MCRLHNRDIAHFDLPLTSFICSRSVMDRGIFFSDPDEESSLDSPHFDLSDSEAKKLSGKFGFKEAQIHRESNAGQPFS